MKTRFLGKKTPEISKYSPKILEKLINEVSTLKFMNGKKFLYNNKIIYITRSGYTGEDGFEISLSNDLVEDFVKKLIDQGAKPIGLGARDTLRLEAGLCLYGHDINESTSPIEANLKWTISKRRRCNILFIIQTDWVV